MRSIRLIVAITAAALLLAAVAAPWLAVHGMTIASLVVQSFFRAVCHQRPERSFLFDGHPWAACVRCSGVYAGLFLGALLRIEKAAAKKTLLAFLFLNIIDVAAEIAGFHGSLPWLRLALGTGLGAAASALLAGYDGRRDLQEKRV